MALAERQHFPGMEAARFYAAGSIILFHLNTMFHLGQPVYSKYIATYFGMGVPLFFIISAMGMCIGYFGKMNTPDDIKDFYWRRFFRIAPLLYVLMLVYIPYWSFTGYSSPSFGNFLATGTFFLNLIPSYVSGYVWGSWTIGVEMLFYLMFPLLLIFASNLTRSIVLFIIATIVGVIWKAEFADQTGALGTFGKFFILAHAYLFAAGIVAFHVWRKIVQAYPNRLRAIGVVLLSTSIPAMILQVVFGGWLIWAAGAYTSWKLNHAIVYTLWAITLSAFTIGMCLAPTKVLSSKWVCQWGRASFGLYLWHLVVIGVLSNLGVYREIYAISGNNPEIGFPVSALVTFAVVVPLSMLTFRFIEKPGMALQKRFGLSKERASDRPKPNMQDVTNDLSSPLQIRLSS